jgi:hypothetical protein
LATDSTYIDHSYFCASVKVEEEGSNTSITIYPNPADDRLVVQRGSYDPVDLVLRDATGRAVRVLEKASFTVEVRLDDLPEGCYFLELSDRPGTRVEKVIVLH